MSELQDKGNKQDREMVMLDINYLVFSGGGAAGVAFAGAIEALSAEKTFSFDQIKAVAGASIGAIAALVVALNYSPKEAQEKIIQINLRQFQDGGNYLAQSYRLFSQYGRYEGQAIYQFILSLINEKTGRDDPENVTFKDIKAMGFKDLFIVATKLYQSNDIPTSKQMVFSRFKTPDSPVAAAILASAAAPAYFARVRLKKMNKGRYIFHPEGDIYNDGGLLNNYPINLFDLPEFFDQALYAKSVNPHTLGFVLRKTEQIIDPEIKAIKRPIKDRDPNHYSKAILDSFLYQLNHAGLDDMENLARSVQIDRLGVKLNDFNITEETKKALMDSGKKAVQKYFRRRANEQPIIAFPSKNRIKRGMAM